MELTTREVSILAWSLVFLAWALTNRDIRSATGALLRSALSRTLVFFVLALGVYAAIELYVLQSLGMWTPRLMKETLLWFGLTAVSSSAASLTVSQEPNIAKPMWDSLRIAVLIELLVGKMTFPLAVELVLVPVFTVFGLLCVVAELKHNGEPVQVFLRRAQVLIGIAVLAAVAHRAVQGPEVFANRGVMSEYLIAPLLSALFIPAMYLSNVYSRYEWLFSKVRGERAYTWYAKWRLLRLLGFRSRRILAFGRQHAFSLPSVRTRADFELLLSARPDR